jgi:hypothetical protein
MSTNAELNNEKNGYLLLRTDKKVIAIIQLIIFFSSLNFMVFINLFTTERTLYETDNGIPQVLLYTLILKPLAVFLGTVLLIKVVQLLLGSRFGKTRLKILRTVLFVIGVIVIALFAGCVLYVFVLFGAKHFSFYFYYDVIKANSSKYILASKIIEIVKNYGIVLAAITGILFMAKSAKKSISD